jgi:hypothetical protein
MFPSQIITDLFMFMHSQLAPAFSRQQFVDCHEQSEFKLHFFEI